LDLSRRNAALAIVIIAIASIVSVISYQYSRSTSEQIEALSAQDIRSNADIQTHDLAHSFANKLGDVVSILHVLSGASSVLQGDLDRSKIIFNQAGDSTSDLVDFYMWLDAKGELVWLSGMNHTTYNQYKETDLSNRPYFVNARDTGQAYYSSVVDSIDGVNRLYVSVPILDNITSPSNQFEGIVVAGLRSDLLGAFLEKQLSPKLKSEVILLDNTGTILYSKEMEYVGKNVFAVGFQSFIASQDVATLRAMNDGFKAALAGNSDMVDITTSDGKVATFVHKPILIEGKQFGVMSIVASHEYASSVSSLIEQQKNFSIFLITITAAAAIVIIFVIITWNRRLQNVVDMKTAELKKANDQLETHGKMQKEFVNIAAHELRTPVQPILGMAEILEAEFGNRRDDIRIITRNARRLERLTQDILDVTRIESQSLNLVVEKFDIGELIETLVQDYRSRVLNGDGNDLQYLQKEESLPIEGDKERLTQVITNFVDNALRFTKNGQVYVTAEREPDGVRVSVGDTGIGIDAYILPRLFTKFASKGERGTGLGLFISKSIIEAHGGKIWGANNSDGKGATFAFAIPSRS
jgi:signal transduction histidine kinase